MTLQQRICPGCGGPVAAAAARCEHCGAWFEPRVAAGDSKQAGRPSLLKSLLMQLPPEAGEFGFTGALPLLSGIVVALVLYALGWLLEDTRYWLAPGAVALWGALLPVWLGLVALVWRTRRTAWHIGLGIALSILAVHLGIVWLISQRINDDLLGIASIFASLALTGWLLGRFVHLLLRRRRIRPMAE